VQTLSVPVNGSVFSRDLHPQAAEHAQHTTKPLTQQAWCMLKFGGNCDGADSIPNKATALLNSATQFNEFYRAVLTPTNVTLRVLCT
jgi:hypothetical protein